MPGGYKSLVCPRIHTPFFSPLFCPLLLSVETPKLNAKAQYVSVPFSPSLLSFSCLLEYLSLCLFSFPSSSYFCSFFLISGAFPLLIFWFSLSLCHQMRFFFCAFSFSLSSYLSISPSLLLSFSAFHSGEAAGLTGDLGGLCSFKMI